MSRTMTRSGSIRAACALGLAFLVCACANVEDSTAVHVAAVVTSPYLQYAGARSAPALLDLTRRGTLPASIRVTPSSLASGR